MELTRLIFPFAASLLIGALIGIDRERKKQEEKNLSAIGIRTSILITLFGTTAGYLGVNYDPWIFYFSLLAMLILTVSSHISLIIRHNRIGITTEITTILLFLYGAMCSYGLIQLAVILAIINALILSLKVYLHTTIANISDQELYDTIKFAIIAFIILPFLPDKNFDQQIFGPFLPDIASGHINGVDIINPYKIWLLIVFVSGISFLGYILIKVLGKKVGISLMGLFGGFYSSTATSLALSDKSKKTKHNLTPYLAGIVLALSTSFIKMFIFIRTLNEELFNRILLPMGIMFLYLLIIGFFLMMKKESRSNKNKIKDKSAKNIETPFQLKKAIQLGAFILGALVIAKISLAYAGIELYYIVATLCALFAVDDPIIVSTSTVAGSLMDFENAKNIILLVSFLNTSQKAAIAYFFGNRKLVKPLLFIFGGLLLVTVLGFLYL